MPFAEGIRLAFQEIASHKLRSFFTLLGIIVWREQSILLTSFPALAGGGAEAPHRRARIAVCNAISDRPGLQYFGIVSRQIPQLVRPDSPIVSETHSGGFTGPSVLMQVSVGGEAAVIPSFDAMEERLGSYAAVLQPD